MWDLRRERDDELVAMHRSLLDSPLLEPPVPSLLRAPIASGA